MNDPEVIRWVVLWVAVCFVAWLFSDRIIRFWWGNGGFEIDKRVK